MLIINAASCAVLTKDAGSNKPRPLVIAQYSRSYMYVRARPFVVHIMLRGAGVQAIDSVASSVKTCFGPNGEYY